MLPVYVHPGIYRLDSLANRQQYDRIFNFERNDIGMPASGAGVGITSEAIFNAKKSRQAEALQQRLKEDEEYNYVSHRFTKALVSKLGQLESPALDTFMRYYRPDYSLLKSFETDYEYYQLIDRSVKSFSLWWKEKYPGIPLKR